MPDDVFEQPVRVFLSHSRKDARLVGRTKDALRIVDSVAFALEDLPGEWTVPDARNRIEEEITRSDMVFLLVSQFGFGLASGHPVGLGVGG